MKYLLILSVFFQQIIFTAEKIGAFKDTCIDNHLVKKYSYKNALDEVTANENYGIIKALKTVRELNSEFNQYIWNDEKVRNCFNHYFITYYEPEKIIGLITNQDCIFKKRPLSNDMYDKLVLVDDVVVGLLWGALCERKKISNLTRIIGGIVIGGIETLLFTKKKNLLPHVVSATMGYRDYKNINTEINNFFDKIKNSEFCKYIFYYLYIKEIVKPSKLYKSSFYDGADNSEIIILSPMGDLVLDNKNAYENILDQNILDLNINFLTPKNKNEINIDFDCIVNIDIPEISPHGYLFDTYKNEAENISQIILNKVKNKKNVLINIISKKYFTPTTAKHELSILLSYIIGLINEQHSIQVSQNDFFNRLDLQRLFQPHSLNVQLIKYFQNIRCRLAYDFQEDATALNNKLLTIAQNLPATHPHKNEILKTLKD